MGTVFTKEHHSGKQSIYVRFKDVDGRVIKRATNARTKALAKRILSQYETDVEKARLQGCKTVDEYRQPKAMVGFRAYVEKYKQHGMVQKGEETWERELGSINKHIFPFFGNIPLSRISIGLVQNYCDRRLKETYRGEPVAARTVHLEITALSNIFREAIKDEILDRNPALMIRKPSIRNKIVRFVTDDEEVRLTKHAKESFRSVLMLAMYTGLRDSELRRLKWSDVDLDRGWIIVRLTKNKEERRVDLCKTAAGVLEELAADMHAPYVLINPRTGGPYMQRFSNTAWANLKLKAEVQNLRFHDLRHTFGTRLAQAGVPITVIQKLMGHKTIQTTMRYIHLAPDSGAQYIKVLDGKSKSTLMSTLTAENAPKRAIENGPVQNNL